MLLVSILYFFANPEVKLVVVFKVAAIHEFGNLRMQCQSSAHVRDWLRVS